jgi:hypothetical protein
MTLLAITWHGYYTAILASAAFITAIGAAIAYLTTWGRSIYDLALRLWRQRQERTTAHAGPKEPTPDQVRVLDSVYRYFLAHGKPEPFWELDKLLDREGLRLREHAESMPRGLLMPDVSHRGGVFHTDDELMVTVDGLRYCAGGMTALDLLASVLEYMARLEKHFMPTSSQSKLVVQAADVEDALQLSPLEVEQTLLLVHQLEPRVWTSITRPTNSSTAWTLTVDPEYIRRFRGIRNGTKYLLARAGTRDSRIA